MPATVPGKRRVFVLAGGGVDPPTGGLLGIEVASGKVAYKYPFRSKNYISVNAASPVVIGFLMLMGIVTKNAIMLVEFALEAMQDGVDHTKAMLDAGHKRARPIIMTTVAMTAGMIPSALAIGAGGEFRSPMAVAVIGGLLLSTVLSLVFVPSLFSAIDGLKIRARRGLVWALGAGQRQTGAQ